MLYEEGSFAFAFLLPQRGEYGSWYITIADAVALQGRIAKVFEMKDEVRLMAEKARAKSMADHDQGRAVERQIEIYEDVLRS